MNRLTPQSLLLSSALQDHEVLEILSPTGLKDIRKADANLQLIADEPRARQLLSECIEELLNCLSRAPDPDQALNYFERFARAALNRSNLLSYLKDSPYTLWLLIKVFGTSPFLSEVLIRFPNYLYWIAEKKTLEEGKPKKELARETERSLENLKTPDLKLELLCVIKNKELLRIGVRDLLGKASVEESTSDLSNLAGVIIHQVYRISEAELKKKWGFPYLASKYEKKKKASFTILALGKLGGGELNFSSDIDLIYLYESSAGKTSGTRTGGAQSRISNPEYFRKLSEEITRSLSAMTARGFLYRVDLRLRPEGGQGEIALPLKGFKDYYAKRGEIWERMALLKAWPVGGSDLLGKKFVQSVAPFIYGTGFEKAIFTEVRKIREMILAKLEMKEREGLNVKLGTGGIREVEFLVQALQLYFGKKCPEIRDRGSLPSLKKFLRRRLFPEEALSHLLEGYLFLRKVENSLQMVNEFQTHSLPEEGEALRECALRLDYRDRENSPAEDQLLSDYLLHTGRINRWFSDLFIAPERSVILKWAAKTLNQ
ncbi:MAG TPA: hypothetical protein VN944_12275 [Nitrospiria bacterium]|nr:hypothetical protein [Nitrospiria bacterium]